MSPPDDPLAPAPQGADPKLIARFFAKVRKTDTCWLWTASRLHDSYGSFDAFGRTDYAHRVSWRLHRGEIPVGMCVCHSCDTPLCVNPEHLFLGSVADNHRDARVKKRHSSQVFHGEANPLAKLTRMQVSQIIDARRQGATVAGLARRYGVAPRTVYSLVRGLTYGGINER